MEESTNHEALNSEARHARQLVKVLNSEGKITPIIFIINCFRAILASVFGELWRLEPLAPQKKAMWHGEMEWLLSVIYSIVDFVPSIQQSPSGGAYEVMAARPRADFSMNLPALKKLDSMLISLPALKKLDSMLIEFVVGGLQLGRKRSGGYHIQKSLQMGCMRMPGRDCSSAGIAQSIF